MHRICLQTESVGQNLYYKFFLATESMWLIQHYAWYICEELCVVDPIWERKRYTRQFPFVVWQFCPSMEELLTVEIWRYIYMTDNRFQVYSKHYNLIQEREFNGAKIILDYD